jgi:hypothetical protein
VGDAGVSPHHALRSTAAGGDRRAGPCHVVHLGAGGVDERGLVWLSDGGEMAAGRRAAAKCRFRRRRLLPCVACTLNSRGSGGREVRCQASNTARRSWRARRNRPLHVRTRKATWMRRPDVFERRPSCSIVDMTPLQTCTASAGERPPRARRAACDANADEDLC